MENLKLQKLTYRLRIYQIEESKTTFQKQMLIFPWDLCTQGLDLVFCTPICCGLEWTLSNGCNTFSFSTLWTRALPSLRSTSVCVVAKSSNSTDQLSDHFLCVTLSSTFMHEFLVCLLHVCSIIY